MPHRLLLAALFICVPAIAVAQPPPPTTPTTVANISLDDDRLRVHFIDVGPGLAVLVESPGNDYRIFIDGGKWGLDGMQSYVEHFVGTEPINLAIVTHSDSDHFRGMERIFDNFAVESLLYSGYNSDELGSQWDHFTVTVDDEEDCEVFWPLSESVLLGDVEILDAGGPGEADDLTIQYLNIAGDPPEQDFYSDRTFDEGERRNNASIVVKLTYGNVSFLITGDVNGRDKDHEGATFDTEIDSEELELWIRHMLDPNIDISSTVLQAPHHGSNGSNSLRFLQAVDPDWVVITAGHQFNHPHPDSLRRIGAAGVAADHVLRTDHGDPTPETAQPRDPRGDDNLIFETDGTTITQIVRIGTP